MSRADDHPIEGQPQQRVEAAASSPAIVQADPADHSAQTGGRMQARPRADELRAQAEVLHPGIGAED